MLFKISQSGTIIATPTLTQIGSQFSTIDDAFDLSTVGADSLTVDANAFLVTSAAGAIGALLSPSGGAWTVAVNGAVTSDAGIGIMLPSGSPASSITVGADGQVSGLTFGIAAGAPANIKNAGTIFATGGAGIATGGLEATTMTIVNSGTIIGSTHSIEGLGIDADKVTNSGSLIGNVDLGLGDDTLTNTSTGRIGGNIFLGGGNDIYNNSGVITGFVDMGDGNDKFIGGGTINESVADGNGADNYKLGGGTDIFTATGNIGNDGIDIIDGGAGIDTYNCEFVTSALKINLDTISHDFSPFNPGSGTVAAKSASAQGTDIGPLDTITGFENAKGGSAADLIYGSAVANDIRGGGGGDIIFGYAGNDNLSGDAGVDALIGGAGKDFLSGGSEADTFFFTSVKDSGLTAATRDTIGDFQDNLDKISLAIIDANTAAVGDQPFHFIGTNVNWDNSGQGQLRAYWTAIGQIIEGDINGDRKADFSIEIQDPQHNIVLDSADFIL